MWKGVVIRCLGAEFHLFFHYSEKSIKIMWRVVKRYESYSP